MSQTPQADTLSQSIVTFSMRSGVGEAIVAGTCDCEYDIKALARQLADMARRADGRLVLDASNISPFTCSWINTLIDLDQLCRSSGGQLVISGLNDVACDMIRSTGLQKRLRVVTSRAEGIRLLRQGQTKSTLLGRLFSRDQAA